MRALLAVLVLSSFASTDALAGITVVPGVRPCVAMPGNGMARIGADECMDIDGGGSGSALTRDQCGGWSLNNGSKVKAIIWAVRLGVNAANAVGTRHARIESFSDAACTSSLRTGKVMLLLHEFSALAAGTEIGVSEVYFVTPTNSSGVTYLRFDDDAGNQGSALIYQVGYWE